MTQKHNDDRRQKIHTWLSDRHIGSAYDPAPIYPEVRAFLSSDLPYVSGRIRKLPHWELDGSTYFVTFGVLNRKPLLVPRRIPDFCPASILEEVIWSFNSDLYRLEAYVIMPDHVHLLLTPFQDYTLGSILRRIKGGAALGINRYLGRKGQFWQGDSFDHLIRNNEDWLDKFNYIHENPVNCGLVRLPQDYPFSSLVTMHSADRMESFGRM
ncbi:MAG: transposase [Deltaproteobacteria bacterium]|nr:transposase [Deltaproteobacteria bacterium]